jgi:hypothetical protein
LGLALCRFDRCEEGIQELREVLRNNPDDQATTRALYIALEMAEAGEAADSGAEE